MTTTTEQTAAAVELPRAIGERVEFAAHGARFYVKKHQAGVYSLNCSPSGGRNRWGNAAEIRNDTLHVQTFGTLPGPTGGRW